MVTPPNGWWNVGVNVVALVAILSLMVGMTGANTDKIESTTERVTAVEVCIEKNREILDLRLQALEQRDERMETKLDLLMGALINVDPKN